MHDGKSGCCSVCMWSPSAVESGFWSGVEVYLLKETPIESGHVLLLAFLLQSIDYITKFDFHAIYFTV